MSHALDVTIGCNILVQLARKHYYANGIVSIIPDIVHLINENEQLHKTMCHIMKQIDRTKNPDITWSQLKDADMEVIDNFFDYLYFTSPQFLKEAP